MVETIVSGGQASADRTARDSAVANGFGVAAWVSKRWPAEVRSRMLSAAGPRGSEGPRIAPATAAVLRAALRGACFGRAPRHAQTAA